MVRDDLVRGPSVREDSVRDDSVREHSVREDSVREDSVRYCRASYGLNAGTAAGQCRGSGGPVRAQRRDDTGAVAGRCRHSWARQGQWRGDELWLERSSKVRFGVRGVDLASHNKYGGLGVL